MKGQDVVIALKLCVSAQWLGFARLSNELGMSMSQIHAGLKRLAESGLYSEATQQIRRHELVGFLTHGLPYVFPARLGQITRGVPTAWASPALAGTPLSSISADDFPPVWPSATGNRKGASVEPVHSSVIQAMKDPAMYALLSAIDALRVGRARERQMAEYELKQRLLHEPS